MTDHTSAGDHPQTRHAGVTERSGRGPTVSVVIPVKDDDAELARCLSALARQTRTADHIIVVDNGSSDRSAAVARQAGATVIRCAEPGIPAASAAGYDHATGDLLLRLDADCVPSDVWIQRVCDAFAERPEVGALTGRALFMGGSTVRRQAMSAAYLLAYVGTTLPALGHLPLFGSNLAMRSDAWSDVRLSVHRHDADVHDDLDLAFHLGERHRIGYLRGSTMTMSLRPFDSLSALRRRFFRGFHTVAVHWPRDFPPMRWWRRARHIGAASPGARGAWPPLPALGLRRRAARAGCR